MRKIVAIVLAAILACSMVVMVSAERPNEEVEVLQFTTAPTIDGVITEAEWGTPTVHVTPDQKTTEYRDAKGVEEDEANIQFDLWLRWDANYYYLGMKYPDSYHGLAASEGSLWNGDVIQMIFDPQGPNAGEDAPMSPFSDPDDDNGATNMSFGLVTGEGNTLSSWAFSGPNGGEPIEGAKYNIKRDGITMTYEIAIPWTSIAVNSVKVGDVFGSTIARVLCDDEEMGYDGWLSWGTGVLGASDVDEDVLSGSNGLRISATSATGAAASAAPAPSAGTTTAPAGTPAPVTADPGVIAAVLSMVSAAGAALVIKKRR